jgi:hypothetical protein
MIIRWFWMYIRMPCSIALRCGRVVRCRTGSARSKWASAMRGLLGAARGIRPGDRFALLVDGERLEEGDAVLRLGAGREVRGLEVALGVGPLLRPHCGVSGFEVAVRGLGGGGCRESEHRQKPETERESHPNLLREGGTRRNVVTR